ncbi:MAG TPA: hypothetical protein VM661_18160 [Candidatus Sulfotelmatobacter sp.]|jgi:hypothetical protein|nr:hypothetical protein [Candidatus Sulfotelmatobacter sp.]
MREQTNPYPAHQSASALRRLIILADALPMRGKVIGWLFMFITAYRAGLPVIYSAALAAVPWLLLPIRDQRRK